MMPAGGWYDVRCVEEVMGMGWGFGERWCIGADAPFERCAVDPLTGEERSCGLGILLRG